MVLLTWKIWHISNYQGLQKYLSTLERCYSKYIQTVEISKLWTLGQILLNVWFCKYCPIGTHPHPSGCMLLISFKLQWKWWVLMRDLRPISLKYFLSGPLCKIFASPCIILLIKIYLIHGSQFPQLSFIELHHLYVNCIICMYHFLWFMGFKKAKKYLFLWFLHRPHFLTISLLFTFIWTVSICI